MRHFDIVVALPEGFCEVWFETAIFETKIITIKC